MNAYIFQTYAYEEGLIVVAANSPEEAAELIEDHEELFIGELSLEIDPEICLILTTGEKLGWDSARDETNQLIESQKLSASKVEMLEKEIEATKQDAHVAPAQCYVIAFCRFMGQLGINCCWYLAETLKLANEEKPRVVIYNNPG